MHACMCGPILVPVVIFNFCHNYDFVLVINCRFLIWCLLLLSILQVRVETDPQDRTQLWIGLRELSYFTSVYPLLAAAIFFGTPFEHCSKKSAAGIILQKLTPF